MATVKEGAAMVVRHPTGRRWPGYHLRRLVKLYALSKMRET